LSAAASDRDRPSRTNAKAKIRRTCAASEHFADNDRNPAAVCSVRVISKAVAKATFLQCESTNQRIESEIRDFGNPPRVTVNASWYKRFSVDARRQKIVAILAACRDCAAFPYRYPAGKLKGTRERRVRPFKIIYRIVEDGVEILAIWHERQSRTMPPESQ
jgi:plasmid stabilization system protein ParE